MDQKQVCASVMRSLNRLRLSESFCDITLLVGDIPIPAHKAVLAGTSKFFHAVLSADGATDMFQINGLSAPDMVKVLDFLYTGQILINKNNVSNIDSMAKHLQIDILSEVCSTFSQNNKKKKATPKTPKHSARGACRTRTYTRWGKQHTLNAGDSSGEEISDVEDLSLDGHLNGPTLTNIGMSLSAVSSCPSGDNVQRENILSESMRRSHIESVIGKSLSKDPDVIAEISGENRREIMPDMFNGAVSDTNRCENTQVLDHSNNHIVLDAVQMSSPKRKESNSHSNNSELISAEVIETSADGTNSIDSMMTEMCKVVDLAGINVYHQHDLTVTSITDPPANHVLISDAGIEGDLAPLIDLQSLLAGFSPGQPVILRTASDGTGIQQEDDLGQPVILRTSADGTGIQQEEDLGQPVILRTSADGTGIQQEDDHGQPIILKSSSDGTQTHEAETLGQPVILRTSSDGTETHHVEDLQDHAAGAAKVVSAQVAAPPGAVRCGEVESVGRGVLGEELVGNLSPGAVHCAEDEEDTNHLHPFDISSISNTGDEAGFHDYCLIGESGRLLQSNEPENECHLSEDLPLQEGPGFSPGRLSQPLDLPQSTGEPEQGTQYCTNKSAPIETAKEEATCPGSFKQDCSQQYLPPTSQKENGDSNSEQLNMDENCKTDIDCEKHSESVDRGSVICKGLCGSVEKLGTVPCRDTHIVIIQEPESLLEHNTLEKNADEKSKQEKRLLCPWCALYLSSSVQLRAHTKQLHFDEMFKCSYCQRCFIERERCENHTDWCRVGKKVGGRYRCPQCVYSAAKAMFVVNHYRTKHTTKYQKACETCNQHFQTPSNYYDHKLQVHHEDIGNLCKKKVHTCKDCNFKTVKAYLLKSHQTIHTEKRHTCKHCRNNFKTVLILKRHEKFVHGDRMLNCSKCTFASKYSAALKTHEYRIHNIKSSLQTVHHCHYCDYSNVDRGDLIKHERFKHSDERPFLCSFCPKAFKHRNQVVVHERTHTGARPFPCSLCSYAARSRVALHNHRNHRHSDKKPFACDLCGFRTKGASNLISHKGRCWKKHKGDAAKEPTEGYKGSSNVSTCGEINMDCSV